MSGDQHQIVIQQVQQSTTETHGKLSTGFDTLNQAIQRETTTLKRKFDQSHDAVITSTDLIRSEISQASSRIPQVEQAVRTSAKQIAKRQRRYARQEGDRLLDRMDQMQAALFNCLSGASSRDTVHPEAITNTTENLEHVVMPLMLMKSSLCEVIGMLESSGDLFLSEEEVQLLQSQIDDILAAGHEASAIALGRRISPVKHGHSAALYQAADVKRPTGSCEPRSQPFTTPQRQLKATWKNHWAFAGRISLGIQRLSPTASRTSITFAPKPELYKLGVSVVLTNQLRAAMHPSISRSIKTFGVLCGRHPAYGAILDDNVPELQRMLSEKEISPWDRFGGAGTFVTVCLYLLDL